MPHKYDPESIKIVTEFVQKALRGEESSLNGPAHVSLQTRTLRLQPRPHLTVNGLEEHWLDSRVDLHLEGAGSRIETKNITDLTVSQVGAKITIDGTTIPNPRGDLRLVKTGGTWRPFQSAASGLHKTPGLQGPVDDAFMEPFLVVIPDGPSKIPQVDQWVTFELAHFLRRWREVFRARLG